METYKDHPLAFLIPKCVDPETLEWRASQWEKKGHRVPGHDVAKTLKAAARAVRDRRNVLDAVLGLAKNGSDRWHSAVRVWSGRTEMHVDETGPEQLRALGQRLRRGQADPYGGSTAASLEHAADDIERFDAGLTRIVEHAHRNDHDAAVAEVLKLLGEQVPEATHEAPARRM